MHNGEDGRRASVPGTPATLTPLLKHLEAAGRVNRLRDPTDERQVRIALTESAQSGGHNHFNDCPESCRHQPSVI
ncbi:transcriptional regulator, SarA/Rot family [Caballeronia sp. KNU42]